MAVELDKSAPSGLLHGAPVSIKEYFGMKGYDGSLAILNWVERPLSEDSVLVKVRTEKRTLINKISYNDPLWYESVNTESCELNITKQLTFNLL